MYESFVDWYWSIFRVGKNYSAFAVQIAAFYSWLMLLASGIAIVRLIKQQLPNFLIWVFVIVAVSYSTTDIVIASLYDFYRFFDSEQGYRAIAISYTLLDSITAIMVMLVMQRKCHSANRFVATADIIVMILLCNGACHFLINGYYMLFDNSQNELAAMLYSATILFNDTLLLALMFFPHLGGKIVSKIFNRPQRFVV
ncbi:hypothetical protein [Pseudoalteromonas sp.]|uniref:hypothetical protein n=1 Tax=Pseudoalteromonas sp. TaxID=53249 RepID=UPI0035648EAA